MALKISQAQADIDVDLAAIANLSSAGVINRVSEGVASVLPVGSVGASVLGSQTIAQAQDLLGVGSTLPLFFSDNYTKLNTSIKTGGLKTDERWLFVPVFIDNYTRIVISRGYNDDSFGYGAISATLEVCTGAWGSSGSGAFARIQKINEFGWLGAFVGATNHLLREVRLLESSSSEVAYSGLWLRVMGDRTYKISGCSAQPTDYATYQPTPPFGTPLSVIMGAGRGSWTRAQPDYNGPSLGDELDPIVRSPNGSRWRISVSDSGVISAIAA